MKKNNFLLWLIGFPTLAFTLSINQYITNNWQTLERSIENCAAYHDPKIGASHVLYLPYDYPITLKIQALKEKCHVKITYLPRPIHRLGDVRTDELKTHGLLYLPYPYVVPGGRFNEMYGWDSYFIILGLLHDQQIQLAHSVLENYFFEIKHYGAILNANRSYHLSRSQPPFLSSAILAIYQMRKNDSHLNKAWLKRAYAFAKKERDQWMRAPWIAGSTHLNRYYDPEKGRLIETKAYPGYYQKVRAYIRKNPQLTQGYLIQNKRKVFILSPDFYQGERSLRASGFDMTFRFGPFGGRTHHYAAICLNSLLYKTERDLAEIAKLLGNKKEMHKWIKCAENRKKLINHYLWNEKTGLFTDYDFMTNQQSAYHYATTFYPLWAGLATPQQAKKLVENLKLFEEKGGLMMSHQATGVQWDKPFGWAPIHLLVVEGLLRYGYFKEAYRIAKKFNETILNNYKKSNSLFEKYNMVTGSSATNYIGYKENVIGFGWTNTTYLIFQDLLKKQVQKNRY